MDATKLIVDTLTNVVNSQGVHNDILRKHHYRLEEVETNVALSHMILDAIQLDRTIRFQAYVV